MISARIVADSLSPQSHRLTSFIIRFPRKLLSEFNTHRALSRNSASSRAIPFKRMLKLVETDPYIPSRWPKEHTGMSATEYFSKDEIEQLCLIEDHLIGRDHAVTIARAQSEKNVSKQVCNRYLEPFMWHTVLITASEFENFFALRADQFAEPDMEILANEMLKVYNESTPKKLSAGQWHMPFSDEVDYIELGRVSGDYYENNPKEVVDVNKWLLQVATARCARISYTTLGDAPQKHDYEGDVKQHGRLVSGGHWSPFEHCAKVMTYDEHRSYIQGISHNGPGYSFSEDARGWCGNFRGFIQYRKMFPNENRSDPRVIKHTY